MRMQAPPTSLILLSAVLLNSFALTTTGMSGSFPFPSTLKYPCRALRAPPYRLRDVDDGRLVALLLLGVLARLLRDEAPQLVEVDGGTPLSVGLQVEVADALLSEHSGVAAQRNEGMICG